MEDYENKYKDALNKAKDMLKRNEVSQEDMEYLFSELKESEEEKPNRTVLLKDFSEGDGFYKVNLAYLTKEQVEEIENIVKKWNPELVESEDEKIKRCIEICLLADANEQRFKDCDTTIKDCLDWIENQSETVEINPTEFDLRLNKLLKQFKILPKDDIIDTLNFYLNVVRNDGTYKADEKQNKFVDMVKSKFEVGNWIVNNISKDVFFIKSVNSGYCTLEDAKGETYYPCLPLDDDFHLWTIDDAKDGDVLMSRAPFIYGKQCPYGGLNWYNGKFIKSSNYVFEDSPVHPATKEQRNLLFAKMKEEGYKWDADRKELKKVEQDDRLLQYITKERNKVDFYYNDKEVSWNDIPYDVRKHDYPYHFIGDLDCFPFFVSEH